MPAMLKHRLIGIRDYAVLNVTVHIPGGLPIGSAKDLDTAKAEFKAAWQSLKARTPPERLAAAFKAMNIRGDG